MSRPLTEAAPGRTGFVADVNGHIIARINAPNQTLSVSTVDGAQYSAHTVAYDKTSGLALLKVDEGADTLKPYIFAHHPAEPQRKVYGIKAQTPVAQSSVVGGTLSGVQPSNGTPPDYYLHNALVGDTGMGGPLFNNCGEVVGVIVPPPKFLARLLISEKESSTAYAVPIEWLVSQFATRGVRPVRAAAPCLSEAEQLAAAEQKTTVTQSKLEEEARRAAVTAQAAVVAQTELDAVKRQLDEAQGAGEDERRRLEAEIQARQGKLDEVRALEITARDALATAQLAVDEARAREVSLRDALESAQRAAQDREKQYQIWGIAGGAALLLLLLLAWAMKRRAVARERREKTAAKSHAEKAQAGLDAREQEDARIRGTPAVFFEGVDFAGQRVALRIPGASIAASKRRCCRPQSGGQ